VIINRKNHPFAETGSKKLLILAEQK